MAKIYSKTKYIYNIPDDPIQFIVRRSLSGGINTRQQANHIEETQAEDLENVDIGVIGERLKRYGSTTIGDDVGAVAPVDIHNYNIQGATDQLLMYEDTTLWKWNGSGNFAAIKADFTASTEVGMVSCKESGLSPDDVVIVSNGVDNPFRIASDGSTQDLGSTTGTGSDSPPSTPVMAWYGNRVWALKNDLLYFSAAYTADYSTAFDTPSDTYRVPVGVARFMIPTRDLGIIIGGENEIWALAPSSTPVATDQPQPIVTNIGCAALGCAVAGGDDIYWFAHDGVRSLKRTVQDKLQLGASFPLSYNLKTQFENINWAYVSKARMVYFDNKVILSLPTGSSTTNNFIWVYYPALGAWSTIDGINAACFTTYKVSGEERLYYGEATADGLCYRLFDDSVWTDNGTTITSTETSREEDMGVPLVTKSGGDLEVEAEVGGTSNTLTINISKDGEAFTLLGSMDISNADSPSLPVSLPFTLADAYVVKEKFSLDGIGAWRTLQIQIINSDANTSAIKIYAYSIITYMDEYTN